MASWAGVNAAAAPAVDGQTKRPFSRRLANRHRPWPSGWDTLRLFGVSPTLGTIRGDFCGPLIPAEELAVEGVTPHGAERGADCGATGANQMRR